MSLPSDVLFLIFRELIHQFNKERRVSGKNLRVSDTIQQYKRNRTMSAKAAKFRLCVGIVCKSWLSVCTRLCNQEILMLCFASECLGKLVFCSKPKSHIVTNQNLASYYRKLEQMHRDIETCIRMMLVENPYVHPHPLLVENVGLYLFLAAHYYAIQLNRLCEEPRERLFCSYFRINETTIIKLAFHVTQEDPCWNKYWKDIVPRSKPAEELHNLISDFCFQRLLYDMEFVVYNSNYTIPYRLYWNIGHRGYCVEGPNFQCVAIPTRNNLPYHLTEVFSSDFHSQNSLEQNPLFQEYRTYMNSKDYVKIKLPT